MAIREQLREREPPLRGQPAERLGLGGEVALECANGVEVAVGEALGRR